LWHPFAARIEIARDVRSAARLPQVLQLFRAFELAFGNGCTVELPAQIRIRAITWKNDQGRFDKLGIIPSPGGIRLVKRDDEVNSLAFSWPSRRTSVSIAAKTASMP